MTPEPVTARHHPSPFQSYPQTGKLTITNTQFCSETDRTPNNPFDSSPSFNHNDSMTPPFTIILPVIPIGKARARITSRGSFTPQRTKDSTEEIKWLLALNKAPRFDGAIALDISFTIIKPKRAAKRAVPTVKPDIDNMVKLFCDAANGVLWKDDAQVVRLLARKNYGESPSIEITVRSLTPLELA